VIFYFIYLKIGMEFFIFWIIREFGSDWNFWICAVKYVNGGTGVCVVRSSRKHYRMVWAAITFITEIRKLPLFFNLLDLSGKNLVMSWGFQRLLNAWMSHVNSF
jgi:hypothetical protein